ncbi:MAG: 23S rRNA (adenine(2503)-C(2))-methyltransferase RlmN [Candidatus Acidiferrales bacterium]
MEKQAPTEDERPSLFGLGVSKLEQVAEECGEPPYRGRQIFHALYNHRSIRFEAMTDLGTTLRQYLTSRFQIAYPGVREQRVSRDKSVRYLMEFGDGEAAEAVYMPERDRATLCLSSQAGCAVDCRFCFTALMGLRRNLDAGEILGQVYRIMQDQNIAPGTRLNLVFMGMGEPLLNYDAVLTSVRILADRNGLGIPPRRMTLSTSGIIPRIQDLGAEEVRPKLAISLNASTSEQRTALMPINRKYPLDELIAACRAYPLRPRERLTFEYVMLGGVNDALEDAGRLAELLKGVRAKVNLIPYNPGDELSYRSSPIERVMAFEGVLREAGVPAFIRISRGRDVRAACGQLLVEGARRPITAIMRPAEFPSLR